MKKTIYQSVFITAILFSFLITGNSGKIFADTLLVEKVVPQFIGSKTASGTNNARTPFAVCLQITGLLPNTAYDVQIGIGLITDAVTSFGAGNVWNRNRNAFTGQRDTLAFTTDGNGDSGPFWSFIQPTGNGSRFDAGQVHNLRIGYAITGGSISGNPAFIGSKQITALDIPATARTVTAADDGAFIKGTGFINESGKYVLLYNNVSGSGNPVYSYQTRNSTATNTTQSDLPVSVNDVFLQSGTSAAGDFAAIVPIGANNPNGIRRIEFRNADYSLFSSYTDADGIFPNGTNTKTLLRREVGIINIFSTLNLKSYIEGLYDNVNNIMTSDTAIIELRNNISPFNLIDQSKDILDANGNGSFNFNNTSNGTPYYIVVNHRNSINTWSATAVSFSSGLMNYDFSDASSKAYGNNMTLKGSKYCIYSGDVNKDETVDASDISSIDNDANNSVSGYVNTDLTGDDFVDAQDLSVVDNNATLGVSTVAP